MISCGKYVVLITPPGQAIDPDRLPPTDTQQGHNKRAFD
jgi:hypothetical protein